MKIIITESQLQSIINHQPVITTDIKNYVKQFNSIEELLRSGGIPTDILDRAAFGFDDTLNHINPDQLHIKWREDYDNVLWEIKKSGLSKVDWAKKINLEEPIEVDFQDKGLGLLFYISDGHHRFVAAKILKKPLKMTLDIKANPITTLAGDLGYDEFHRALWRTFHEKMINEMKNRGQSL